MENGQRISGGGAIGVFTLDVEVWPYVKPFHITGKSWTEAPVVMARVRRDGAVGRGEAFGVYYKGETAQTIADEFASSDLVEFSGSRGALIERLGPGGLRNALDCALWDLEAKIGGAAAWRLAGLEPPRPLPTTITLGAERPADMQASLRGLRSARALKLKLTGDAEDAERVRLARRERPDAWIGVDANQAYDPDGLDGVMGAFVDAGVALVEQPFPVGREAWLDGLDSSIPVAADESVCDIADLERVEGRVAYVNLKLDKCGGLTRGLALAAQARRRGFKLMVGNMGGTTLAMAPAFLLAQVCDLADLDGPTVLREDRAPAATYADGEIWCPPEAWGSSL